MADHNFKVPLPKAATNFKVPKLPRVHYKKTGNILPPETPSSSNSLSLRSFQVPSLEARYKNNDEASSSMHSIASASASLFGRSNCEVSQNSSLRSLSNGPSFSRNNSLVQGRKNPFSDTTCNGFPFEASSSTSAMPSSTSSIQKSNFKVPKGNVFVNNASNQLSVKDFASTSSSSTLKESFMSFNSTKKSLFESGLDLVSQGKFGKPKRVYSDRSMSNQLMLPDSSRMITGIPRDDEESVAGSVMSLTSNMSVMNSFKSRLKNTFETMESYLKSNFSRTDQDRFMLETFLRRNQEILLNDMQRDLTLAMSFRDVDACSTFNETARTFLGSMASRTQCNNVSAIKSSKDYLSEVQAQQTHQIQFFTHYETSRTGNALKKITEYDENDENDESALFRSKPEKAPKILLKKQSREPVLCQKKSEKQNENQNLKNVIYLEKWFPVADGNDLKFSGTDKKQKMIETKAIKKRIDNRTVELIDGKKCVIQGSPDSSIVSSFPKSIVSKLTNGLHQRWKVLQKDISNCQKNFNSIIQTKNQDGDKKHSDIECTPRTRKITAKEKEFLRDKENVLNSPLNTSTPIRSKGSEKNNGTLLVKPHPVVMIDKNEFTKAVSPEKSVKKVEERKRHSLEKSVRKFGDKKKNSPGKKTVEKEVQKSRSGRTIKPLGSLWTDSSYIFNVHRKPSPEKKSQQEKQVTNHGKRDSLKRKRDADNDNEIGVKPAKVRKNRSEDSVASNSPVKRKKKSPKVKNIPEKKNKQLPARTKSPMKTKSPVKRKSPKKLKSPAKKKSPVKRKSLVKTKSPVKKKSPIKNKSPAINSPGKRKNKNKEKKQRENSILAKGKKKKEQPSAPAEFDDFECQLDDIDLPEISAAERKSQLSKSQLRIASMETPPLQYFSQNLRLLNTTGTPHQSPDWQLSQHSQSAVRRFEERRAKTFKQKIPAGSPVPRKNPVKNTRKSPRNKDLKTVTDWIGDKDVRSPKQRSKLINLVIPSRRQLEEDDESDSD